MQLPTSLFMMMFTLLPSLLSNHLEVCHHFGKVRPTLLSALLRTSLSALQVKLDPRFVSGDTPPLSCRAFLLRLLNNLKQVYITLNMAEEALAIVRYAHLAQCICGRPCTLPCCRGCLSSVICCITCCRAQSNVWLVQRLCRSARGSNVEVLEALRPGHGVHQELMSTGNQWLWRSCLYCPVTHLPSKHNHVHVSAWYEQYEFANHVGLCRMLLVFAAGTCVPQHQQARCQSCSVTRGCACMA